ncbi:MAG: glycosyltransferase [Parvularculaceae bacterium]
MNAEPDRHDKELLVVSNAPVRPIGDEAVIDKKFVAGMTRYEALWGGPIRCAMRARPDADPPFSATFSADSLPFRLVPVAGDGPFPPDLLDGASIVLAGADGHAQFDISRQCRARNIPCVYIIENTLETRLSIAWLEDRPLLARLKTMVWLITAEPRRRRALALANGIQANGAPAAKRYGGLSDDVLAFFGTRMSEAAIPTAEALEARLAGLETDRPLRLAFSGRLDPIKGVDHLPRLMIRLSAEGIDATLDLFGTGPLEDRLRQEIAQRGLGDRMRLHGAVDFDTELVPFMKSSADLFVCCHRQSDPSCTYFETLACGVPIAGYANRAFRGILEQADIGWSAPIDGIDALARRIAKARSTPGEIARKSRTALELARPHAFEPTFERRIGQLQRIADLDP